MALPLPCTVADHVALAERLLPADSVPAQAWRRLRRIADPWPPTAHEAGLELRLDDADPRLDLAVCLRVSGSGRSRLAEAAAGCGPGWRRAGSFLGEWARPASLLHDVVRAIWLEFDARGEQAPEPFLIFTLDRERTHPGGRASSNVVIPAVLSGLDRLSEASNRRAAAAVEPFLRRLPPFAQVCHAALRPTPRGDVVRLVIRMPWRLAPSALRALGWPGDAAELHVLLERLCPDTRVHAFNLDVSFQGPGPRVGIELRHHGPPAGTPRWRVLLDELMAWGACGPARRAAIEGWGGTWLGPTLGPGRLGVRRDLLVKAVHEPGAPLRAKAYLAFAPRLLLAARAAAPAVQPIS